MYLPGWYYDHKYQNAQSLYAALALDSYSRGYDADVHEFGNVLAGLQADEEQVLGRATIIFDSSKLGETGSDVRRDIAVGFYAVAYVVGSEVVISFRGSNELETDDFGTVTSIANGFIDDHLRLALEFYNLVEDEIATNTSLAGMEIVSVGHSLGGAIAGVVSSVKRSAGLMFDNTAFENAAGSVMDAVTGATPDVALQDLVFRGATPWSVAQASSLKTIALVNDVAGIFYRGAQQARMDLDYELGTFELGLGDFGTAHVQALLAFRMLLEERFGPSGAWIHAADMVIAPLMDDVLAIDIGVRAAESGNPASGVLKDMISQSIIGGIFGSSAANALVDDMNDLGVALLAGAEFTAGLGYDVARYASGLAAHDVDGRDSGFLHLDSATNVLIADYSTAVWSTVGDVAYVEPYRGDLDLVMQDGVLSSSEVADLLDRPVHGQFDIYAFSNAGPVTLDNAHQATLKYIGTAGLDQVVGSVGRDIVQLGDGNDEFFADSGIHWVEGGDGSDTLWTSSLWRDFTVTRHGETTILAKKGATSTPTVFIVDGIEKFVFSGQQIDLTDLDNHKPTDIRLVSIQGQTSHSGLSEAIYAGGTIIADLTSNDVDRLDRWTWELTGNSANFFTIDCNGVLRTNGTQTFDFETWRYLLGGTAPAQSAWDAGNLPAKAQALIGTQYVASVKVTDAHGESWSENIFLYIKNEIDTSSDGSIIGTDRGETIFGTSGDDSINGFGGIDHLYGGEGNDKLYGYIMNGAGSDPYNPNIIVDGDDFLYGGGGDDFLFGGKGADLLDGGSGNDVIDYRYSRAALVVDLEAQTITGGDATGDTLISIEGIHASPFADTILGSSGANILYGKAGNDVIYGYGGNDLIVGGPGGDTMHGGAGNDIIYAHATNEANGSGIDRAVFSGSMSAYTFEIAHSNSPWIYVKGPDGDDDCWSIKEFVFDDGTLTRAQILDIWL